VCEDELREMMRDSKPSFVITVREHLDSVQFASAADTQSQHHATKPKVHYVASRQTYTLLKNLHFRCLPTSSRQDRTVGGRRNLIRLWQIFRDLNFDESVEDDYVDVR